MKKIWKFELHLWEGLRQVIKMPKDATVLCAQTQTIATGLPTIMFWATVDPDAEKEERTFRIIGTGHDIEEYDSLVFIDTVQTPPYVWHVFEEK
jgi:hypothetical protein